MNAPAIPGEPELAARVTGLSDSAAHYVLYWLATGSDAIRADLAAALDAADRRERDLEQIRASGEAGGAR